MSDWRECCHRWASYFGPVLMCQKCGATTMVAAAPGESKPIFAPLKASNARGLRAGAAEPATTETGVAGSVNTALLDGAK